ncbi:MAG: DUF418 domain-containing protein [Saprospiraceae bacterium]|nr:DUF418 domain-containing protein [Saprospiraceae bacterium]
MTTQENIKPTHLRERINSVDVIRGVALLGILLMNITGFGLYKAYMDPTNAGGATGWNLNVWWVTNLFFEGTMRAMFSMLFGAGIILFTSKAIESSNGVTVTDAFFRRLGWMLIFGIIHCYLLLWSGEILYAYAIVGMIAFNFRHWVPKNLIIGSVILLCLSSFWSIKDYYSLKSLATSAATAMEKKDKGLILSKEETASIGKLEEKVKENKAKPEEVDEENAAMYKDYFSIVLHKGPENQWMQTTFLYRYNFFDVLAMMLMGMAFLRNGILRAERSNRFYLLMMVIGYALGLTINYLETSYIVAHNFDMLAFSRSFFTYDLGRIFTTCGHIGTVMLFIKSGWLVFLKKSLAAVGQMALTNYIMHTIICNTIFLGFGFAMFGKLQRYELYYVVGGIWLFQLVVSPIWLRYYRFGPLEWVWRSLTYWERQSMKKTA